ncbi:helix-turn-helix domain-containing protein [Clostridium chromiireducens]|uniref:Helix-turn-helix domain-containing protein n=1 Tax=Clostridium chromiireducens TaxID=225345 RepID=A0A964W452_9CLOT|nr:helix-turn-helix transcriptional regulator [Clostridium chromiireducens]MVX65902.1 helix-turn-helix domain-containing protein [Clostridium chromiireducens]
MILGKKIKLYRNKLNLSQEELAKRCNLSRNAIYNYENNKRTPTISVLIEIAKNLDVSPTDLLNDIYNVGTFSNELETIKLVDKNLNNTINEEKENITNSELKIDELYDKYFLDLFKWKTSNITYHDYFKFILSSCPLTKTNHLTEEDLNELSVLFYRLLTLKVHERNELQSIYIKEQPIRN